MTRIPAARSCSTSSTHTRSRGCAPQDVERRRLYTRSSVELYAAYDAQCQREGVVDFAELLLRSYELLSRNEPLARPLPGRFRHILVDEFQDTNRLQYRWLKLLAGPDARGVRGRRRRPVDLCLPRRASRQHAAISSAISRVEQVIKLEQNYRSHGNILDAANALITHNRGAPRQEPVDRRGHRRAAARCSRPPTIRTRPQFIVDEVTRADARRRRAAEIALLYRSNAQSRVLEHALFNAGMPYRVYGGLRFFERAGNQARAGLPAPGRQPRRRRRAAAGDQLPGARHRRAQPRTAAGSRQAERHPACGRRRKRDSSAARRASSIGAFVRLIESDAGHLRRPAAAGADRARARAERPAWRITRPRRKARTGSTTSTNWSMPPRLRRRRTSDRGQPSCRPARSSPMPRWRRASTRPGRAATRCS